MFPIAYIVTICASILFHLSMQQKSHDCIFTTTGRAAEKCLITHYGVTEIPAIVPTEDSIRQAFHNNHLLLYIAINDATKDYYSVSYDWAANCRGGATCSLATFYAAKMNTLAPNNERFVSNHSEETTYYLLDLHHQIVGKLQKKQFTGLPETLWRTLSWNQAGVRYQLSIKNHADPFFIAIANDTIDKIDALNSTNHKS